MSGLNVSCTNDPSPPAPDLMEHDLVALRQ
jgi:hypothetical protein